MSAPRLYLHFENETRKGENFFVFFLELIPSITFRFVRGGFGKEANLYISWLLWTFTITLSWRPLPKSNS